MPVPAPLDACALVELPKIADQRGNLTFIEGANHIPFPIERVYYLYDVPGGAQRGGHAHRELNQLMIAVAGSFDVVLNNGVESTTVHLDRAFQGLIITPMVWRELVNFSSGSVCLVLASMPYDEADYYRDFDEFVAAVRAG